MLSSQIGHHQSRQPIARCRSVSGAASVLCVAEYWWRWWWVRHPAPLLCVGVGAGGVEHIDSF